MLHGTGPPSSPTISDIPDQSTPMNTPTAPIPFTVGAPGGAVESLLLIADSSDPALVPTNNIAFGGSGADRTMIVTPETEQTGTALITVTVSNGATTASDQFMLTVNPVAETLSITPSGADSYLIRVRGIPRTTYDIQFTGPLSPTEWQLLATATTDAQGAGETLDPLIPGTEARFYRAVRKKP